MKIIDTNLEWLENTFVKLFTFLTFSHVYIIILIELVLTIYNWIKTKKVPWIHLGLFAFPLVIIESSFIGTCAEFMRTSIYVLPFAYIALATYIDMLIQNKNVEKFKRRRY